MLRDHERISHHDVCEPEEQKEALAPSRRSSPLGRPARAVHRPDRTRHFRAPPAHESLRQFPFDSVLVPCNFAMLAQPEYASDFQELYETCRERGVAFQTIKSVAGQR